MSKYTYEEISKITRKEFVERNIQIDEIELDMSEKDHREMMALIRCGWKGKGNYSTQECVLAFLCEDELRKIENEQRTT